jgi:POT family proton-dependent oligopeptide transporter
MKASSEDMFKSTVLGHPQGLFILFFTEMWERFSYYGMRALLVLFLVSAMGMGGWDWTTEQALALYGTYTSMVYLTPILGGYLADRYIGYRRAVVIGAVVMTLGHVAMAIEFSHAFLYIGIGLLIIGNGFFKPNITSIISHMYKDTPEKKDGAYTIFYMGVNAGAFLGIMLCGYLGETLGWSYGFGLAGIFMLLGMFQFYFAQKIFGDIGTKPNQQEIASPKLEFESDRFNPFSKLDMVMVILSALGGVVWIINNPLTKIAGINVLKIGSYDASNAVILSSLILFFILIVSRLIRYPKITRERMIAIVLFAVFTIIFWAAFEQAGGSMTIFAKDYTTRILSGSSATIFNVVNIIITVVPIGIISWVLFLLFRKTFKRFTLSSIFLGSSFVIIWCIVGWMINRNLNSKAYVVAYDQVQTISTDKKTGEEVKNLAIVNAATKTAPDALLVKGSMTIRESMDFKIGQKVLLVDTDKEGSLKYMDNAKSGKVEAVRRVTGTVTELKDKEVEIPASWFGILNSLFIIAFAPLFSKWWESRFNPSGASKYGIGLILLGIGFGALALGSMGIVKGDTGVTVSMIWLIVAYLFHTLGELCLSPVALSYISKLVPGRMIALMFGVWYIAIAIGNKLAGEMGGQIDKIQEAHSMSFFFMIFTLVPAGIGLAAILLNPLMKRLMHGVK